MYLHRYLRVMPVLAFLVLVVISIYKMFGIGPYYKFMTEAIFINNCKKYYWTTLLHIQNYYNPLNVVRFKTWITLKYVIKNQYLNFQCIPPSWYLSADFQLVLVSPLLVYPAYKYGWKFMWIFPCYIVGTIIWAFTASMTYEYRPARHLMFVSIFDKFIYFIINLKFD